MILRTKKSLLLTAAVLLIVITGVYTKIFFKESNSDNLLERVVLITIDTLRADHLGAYGYIRNTSPFFDSLAKQGVLFKNNLVAMSLTCPSHASLFTSLYPIQHGIQKNGLKLDLKFITMAEIFQEMGYNTAGIVSYGAFSKINFDQGFEYFDAPSYIFYKTKLYRPARDTVDAAIEWLDTINPGEKFLLWIHLYDPHGPLRPPQEHYDKLVSSSDRNTLTSFWLNQHHVTASFFNNLKTMFEKITKYDAEIRYADSELQRLFQYYQQRGFDNKSLWVITSDHGEGVGSHNYWGHGLNVYNEQLRVPLLFYSSQSHSRGQMVEQAVENVDILPTIIELTKGKPCFDHEEGKSLVPLMYQDQPRTYGKTYAFSQRRIYNKIDPQVNNSKVKNYEAGEKYSLQSQGFKYIYRTAGPDEFYNLRTDPYEINNLINQGVDEEVRLRDALLSELAELSKSAHGASEIADKETIEHLKTLGYIQ